MKKLLVVFIMVLSLFLVSCSEEVICPECQICPQIVKESSKILVDDGIIDISDFPSLFIENEYFQGLIVAGQNAAPIDVLPAIILASSVEKYFPKLPLLDVNVEDPVNQDIIIIGGPCINSVAAIIFGNPQECNKVYSINNGNSFISNMGNIKLIKHDNGHYALFVGGFSGLDSVLAVNILIHRTSELKGMEFTVTSPDGTWQNAVINKVG